MPAPDGYLPNKPAQNGPKKNSPAPPPPRLPQPPRSGSYGDPSVTATTPSAPTGGAVGAVLGLSRPPEMLYETLAAQPLPVQGAVADLVDKLSFGTQNGEVARKVLKLTPTQLVGPAPPKTISKTIEGQYRQGEAPPDLAMRADYTQDSVDRVVEVENPEYTEWQAKMRQAERIERRATLGGQQAHEKPKPTQRPEVNRMSWAEYNALEPRARAAVDFNTMLVQAVRKDLRLNRSGEYDDVTKTQRASYKDAVTDLFGKGRGSKMYAPETVAMLNQLRSPDEMGDLDDFLKLRVAITDEQLKYLDDKVKSPLADVNKVDVGGEEVQLPIPDTTQPDQVRQQEFAGLNMGEEKRLALAQRLVDSTLDFTERLEESGAMIQSFRASVRNDRDEWVGTFGGNPNLVEPDFGFRPTTAADFDPTTGVPLNDNAYISSTFEMLLDPARDPEPILANLNQNVPHLKRALYHYISTQLDQAPSLEAQVVEGSRTVAEMRQLLGLKGGGSSGGQRVDRTEGSGTERLRLW